MADKVIGTKLELKGEKEFNQQMKAINSGLKTTKSDMAALSAEFDGNANSMKALTAKQKLLRSSVDQHKEKVEALTKQYKAAAATYGENSYSAQKYRQQLNQATVALQKETAALEKNSDALKEKYLAGLKAASAGAKKIFSGLGTAAGGVAKGVGAITAASAAGVAAIGAGGVVALTTMVSMAKEAADAAKAAREAGETLTASQEQWLAFSGQLDALDASVVSAKNALGGVLLPILGDLSEEGAAFLNAFAADMEAAAGDTEQQGKIMADYIVKGAKLIKEKLPEYIKVGKELLSGLGEGIAQEAPALLDMGLDLCMELLDGIIENAPQLAEGGMALIEKLTQSLIDRGPDLITSAVGMVTQIVTGLAQAAPDLIPMAAELITTLITALAQNAPDLLIAGLELIYGIISGIFTGLGDIGNSADDIIEALVSAFEEKGDDILAIGSKIISLIKEGISNAWGNLVSWFGNLLANLSGKATIETEQPDGSHASGLNYVPYDGYLAELHRGEMVLTAADAALYRKGNPSTNKTVNLYVTTHSLTESDVNMLVDVVNRKLGDDI